MRTVREYIGSVKPNSHTTSQTLPPADIRRLIRAKLAEWERADSIPAAALPRLPNGRVMRPGPQAHNGGLGLLPARAVRPRKRRRSVRVLVLVIDTRKGVR